MTPVQLANSCLQLLRLEELRGGHAVVVYQKDERIRTQDSDWHGETIGLSRHMPDAVKLLNRAGIHVRFGTPQKFLWWSFPDNRITITRERNLQ